MEKNIKLWIWFLLNIVIALIVRYGFESLSIYIEDYFNLSLSFYSISRMILMFFVVLIWIAIVIRSEHIVSKLPWLIILTLEPFVGLALFSTFGRSYIKSRRYRKRPLSKPGEYLTHEPTTDFSKDEYLKIDSEITDIYKTAFYSTKHHAYLHSNKVTVLTDGTEKFNRLVIELEKAQSFILMQYFIIKTDQTGRKILNILKEKAKEGLEVYLLYDSIGSVFLDKKFIKTLKDANVKIVKNEPVFFGLFNTKINYRNHRKITVIDGKCGFTGGMNLADEYKNVTSPFGHFRDTHLLIEGDSVQSLTQVFFRDWYFNTKTLVKDERFFKTYPVQQKGLVQIVPSGPEFKHPPIRNMYVKMINNAKISIKIMTPYIALDHELLTSLVIASNSGVTIDIIIPGIPDKPSVYQVTKSFVDDLIEVGINVHVYNKGFTHAKVFIIDDHLASCGTYNFDNRSARINFEVTALLYKTGVKKLVSDFNNDLLECTQINPEKWLNKSLYRRLTEGLFNLFSPLV